MNVFKPYNLNKKNSLSLLNDRERINITNLLINDPDSVLELEGITLLNRSINRELKEDCFKYIYPQANNMSINMFLSMKRHSTFKPGAIAAYYEINEWVEGGGKNYLHIGRISEDNLVISKWGVCGDILKHKIELVPHIYGDYVDFLF